MNNNFLFRLIDSVTAITNKAKEENNLDILKKAGHFFSLLLQIKELSVAFQNSKNRTLGGASNYSGMSPDRILTILQQIDLQLSDFQEDHPYSELLARSGLFIELHDELDGQYGILLNNPIHPNDTS